MISISQITKYNLIIMGISQSTQTPNRIQTQFYYASKSHSKSRRIFNTGNKQNKQIPATHLQFSRINSIEENHVSRPSQSMMNMLSSRLNNSTQLQKMNLEFYKSLALPAYSYQQEGELDMYGVEYRQNVKYHGIVYSGGTRESKPHGKGRFVSDYEQYEGWFQNGVKSIHGREVLSNQVYEGQYSEGRRKGVGVLYNKQATYKGQFNEVFLKGIIQYKDGRIYEGEVDTKQSKKGKGVFKWPNGSQYQGQFWDNNFNGKGIYIDVDGGRFEGTFTNGVKNQMGAYSCKKKDIGYQGSYLNNKKHGMGKYWFSVKKNYYYEGQWKQDKPHNSGVLRNQFGERNVVHENGILKQIL